MRGRLLLVLSLPLLALVLALGLAACQGGSLSSLSLGTPMALGQGTPAAATTPGQASLMVQAEPVGAQIAIDGIVVGTSPMTLTIPSGDHHIQVSSDGYAPVSDTIRLAPGQQGIYSPALTDVVSPTVKLTVGQTTLPWLGTTQVRAEASDPLGIAELQLLLNGQMLGDAAGDKLSLDLSPSLIPGLVPSNTYTLTARAADVQGHTGESSLALTIGGLPEQTPSGTAVATPAAPAGTPRPGQPLTPTVAATVRPTGTLPVTATAVLTGSVEGDETPGPEGTPKAIEPIPTDEIGAEPPDATPPPVAASLSVKKISIPTYPFGGYLRQVVDPAMGNYPLLVLDRAAYDLSNPQPTPRSYTLVVLENQYLRLGFLPELGGRIYECVFKPTGHEELYQNPVIKPTHWGPSAPAHPEGANWWLAVGGIEWGFPVEEHGYEFASRWGYDPLPQADGSVMVSLFTSDSSIPYADVDIILPADAAYFIVRPHISNPLDKAFRFKWWTDAMLAPGGTNKPGADTRFVYPTSQMTVHSTGDTTLPAAGQALSWPLYNGRDLSRLGNLDQYLGFFERPAAQGNFTAVYDAAVNEGLVRVFPADKAKGAKGFAPGWRNPMDWHEWTDDPANKGSGYVEMHGGLTPTFDDWYELGPQQDVTWDETWYPVAGIGGLSYANGSAAVNIARAGTALKVGVFGTQVMQGKLVVSWQGSGPITRDVELAPETPFNEVLSGAPAAGGEVQVTLTDTSGQTLLSYKQKVP